MTTSQCLTHTPSEYRSFSTDLIKYHEEVPFNLLQGRIKEETHIDSKQILVATCVPIVEQCSLKSPRAILFVPQLGLSHNDLLSNPRNMALSTSCVLTKPFQNMFKRKEWGLSITKPRLKSRLTRNFVILPPSRCWDASP